MVYYLQCVTCGKLVLTDNTTAMAISAFSAYMHIEYMVPCTCVTK